MCYNIKTEIAKLYISQAVFHYQNASRNFISQTDQKTGTMEIDISHISITKSQEDSGINNKNKNK